MRDTRITCVSICRLPASCRSQTTTRGPKSRSPSQFYHRRRLRRYRRMFTIAHSAFAAACRCCGWLTVGAAGARGWLYAFPIGVIPIGISRVLAEMVRMPTFASAVGRKGAGGCDAVRTDSIFRLRAWDAGRRRMSRCAHGRPGRAWRTGCRGARQCSRRLPIDQFCTGSPRCPLAQETRRERQRSRHSPAATSHPAGRSGTPARNNAMAWPPTRGKECRSSRPTSWRSSMIW